MGSWNELVEEVSKTGTAFDRVRRKHLEEMHCQTGRNIIDYYSGWLQKGDIIDQDRLFSINDSDKDGFMATIHGLDRGKGLDLFLHTPGGDLAATESLVDHLHAIFEGDMRAIVPQLAMSAGTMVACACREIVMGKHSSLGPIDPQFGALAAHGVVEEFTRAKQEIAADQNAIAVWQPIIAKYPPTFIGECEKAIIWSKEIVKQWLVGCMFKGLTNAETKADKVINELGDHSLTKSHSRHISANKAKEIGLNVDLLEAPKGTADRESAQKFQDAVLSVHHACILTLSASPACKIIENHLGVASILTKDGLNCTWVGNCSASAPMNLGSHCVIHRPRTTIPLELSPPSSHTAVFFFFFTATS